MHLHRIGLFYLLWLSGNVDIVMLLAMLLIGLLMKVLMPRMMGQPTEPQKIQRALVELSSTLDKLEDMFLKRQPFLCGDDISLADLLAICEIMQVSMSKDCTDIP